MESNKRYYKIENMSFDFNLYIVQHLIHNQMKRKTTRIKEIEAENVII